MFSNVLLTVDFDRTLTAPDSSIPRRNLEAIEYFMANGGTFTMNTGRSVPMSVRNIIGKVPVNAPLLLYNGSADYDGEKAQFTRFAPIALEADRFVDDLQNRFPDLNVEIQAVDAHYLIRKDSGWEGYCENNNCAWGYGYPSQIPGPFVKVAIYGQFRENTVASMYETTPWEKALFDEAIAYLEKTYGEKVDLFRACARILDIHAKGCSKGNAARSLQKALGKKILVCVGDAQNDLTMLQQADHAFCPADGEVADRFPNVCVCGEGAVADVIYEKIPEILAKQP